MKAHVKLKFCDREHWLSLMPHWAVANPSSWCVQATSVRPPSEPYTYLVFYEGDYAQAKRVYVRQRNIKVRRGWQIVEEERATTPVNPTKHLEWRRALNTFKKGLLARQRLGLWEIKRYKSAWHGEEAMVIKTAEAMKTGDLSTELLKQLTEYIQLPRRSRKCDGADLWRVSDLQAHMRVCVPCTRYAINAWFTKHSLTLRQRFGVFDEPTES